MFTGSMGRISVFCSYAREDESIRRQLEAHLAPLRDERIIDDWHDSRIQPGARWNAEIEAALDRARLMLFIVTPDLLASRYVTDVEVEKSLERERAGLCQVVPIMARRAEWQESPLAQFQALPSGGRWIGDYPHADIALREIASGVRDVCRRIVDWENPYKRAQIGDWVHVEMTGTLEGGESMTVEGTEELVAKTERDATLQMAYAVQGELLQRTMTIDLTQPLDDRIGDILRQGGVGVPANLEIALGPAHYADEVLNIGGRTYETIRARRELRLEQRGDRLAGSGCTWRSIDVPLFGMVKGESVLGPMRQRAVLLDFGHGDAATRKPRVGSGAVAPPPQPAVRSVPSPLVSPGRWQGQMNTLGTVTAFDMILYPNGALQGQQVTMGVASELQGQWSFDPAGGSLTLQVVAMMMGVPISQELLQLHITRTHGSVVYAQDHVGGRQFVLQRVG